MKNQTHFFVNFILNCLFIIEISFFIFFTTINPRGVIMLSSFIYILYNVAFTTMFYNKKYNNSKTKNICFGLLNLMFTPLFAIVNYIIYNHVLNNEEKRWFILPMISLTFLSFVIYNAFLYYFYQKSTFFQLFFNFLFIKINTECTILKFFYILGCGILLSLNIILVILQIFTDKQIITVITIVIVFIVFVYVIINLLVFTFFIKFKNTSIVKHNCILENESNNVSIY